MNLRDDCASAVPVIGRTVVDRCGLIAALSLALIVVTGVCRGDAIDDDEAMLRAPQEPSEAQICMVSTFDIPLRIERGSAGIMYNLAEHPESIRAVAKDLLRHAVNTSVQAQNASVTTDCPLDRADKIVFTVSPITYRPEQEQQPLCLQLSRETKTQPLVYGLRNFLSVEQFDDWMTKFTQGRGEDGKLLYQQCGGDCDPSYTFVIEPDGLGLSVDTTVFCGFSRDRGNGDMFEITTMLRPRFKRENSVGRSVAQ